MVMIIKSQDYSRETNKHTLNKQGDQLRAAGAAASGEEPKKDPYRHCKSHTHTHTHAMQWKKGMMEQKEEEERDGVGGVLAFTVAVFFPLNTKLLHSVHLSTAGHFHTDGISVSTASSSI